MGKKTEDAQPVIDGDHHNAFAGQRLAIIGAGTGIAARESAAMNPDHDRKMVTGSPGGRPYIKVEAIFAQRWKLAVIEHRCRRIRSLPAGIGKLLGFANALPLGWRCRR